MIYASNFLFSLKLLLNFMEMCKRSDRWWKVEVNKPDSVVKWNTMRQGFSGES